MYKKLKDMNLKAGDVVILRQWSSGGGGLGLGERYKVNADITKADRMDGTQGWFGIDTNHALFEKEVTTVDLTKITTPLGVLKEQDPATYYALIKHGGPYQCFCYNDGEYGWVERTDISTTTHQALAWRVKPVVTEWFLNIYDSYSSIAYKTREEADKAAARARLKCIKVVEAKD
jgi:hypothetical protein